VATEIERKFLVLDVETLKVDSRHYKWDGMYEIVQGYLSLDPERQVRVRTSRKVRHTFASDVPVETKGFITIKGKSSGISRSEHEYEIPYMEAQQLLTKCVGSLVVKQRTVFNGWEVDVFEGDNEGLIVAEYELDSEDQELQLPAWVGKEVSEDHRYSNIHLAVHPFKDWGVETPTPVLGNPSKQLLRTAQRS
jgi:adenylate cyclase